MTTQFDGRVALVMGAATGIGKVTSELFAREGANVVMADVNPEVLRAFTQLGRTDGVRGFAQVADISKLDDCQALADRVVDQLGRIDALVIVSGIIQDAAQVGELATQEWDRVMDVNLKGHFLMAKAVIPQMRRQRSGRIILVASFWGRKGFAYYAAYCASKAGVISLAQTLAEEMAQYDVTVNSVAPGNINTRMHQDALRDEAAKRGMSYEEFRDGEWAKIPLRKAGDPEDIAQSILFLASDQAKYITGASLDVNGGLLLR
jgi:NAD(P)-dependent dehydrogenase (short-subunit alcohol dehydrogenase family)